MPYFWLLLHQQPVMWPALAVPASLSPTPAHGLGPPGASGTRCWVAGFKPNPILLTSCHHRLSPPPWRLWITAQGCLGYSECTPRGCGGARGTCEPWNWHRELIRSRSPPLPAHTPLEVFCRPWPQETCPTILVGVTSGGWSIQGAPQESL